MGLGGELLPRRFRSQQMQVQQFAAAVARQRLEIEFPGGLMVVDNLEIEVARIDAALANRRDGLRVRQDIDRQPVVAPDMALPVQILVKLGGFGGKARGDAKAEALPAGKGIIPVKVNAISGEVERDSAGKPVLDYNMAMPAMLLSNSGVMRENSGWPSTR